MAPAEAVSETHEIRDLYFCPTIISYFLICKVHLEVRGARDSWLNLVKINMNKEQGRKSMLLERKQALHLQKAVGGREIKQSSMFTKRRVNMAVGQFFSFFLFRIGMKRQERKVKHSPRKGFGAAWCRLCMLVCVCVLDLMAEKCWKKN